MKTLLDLLEAQLESVRNEWGDAETMRLIESTRDAELASAEVAFFSEKLRGAVSVRGEASLLLLDLGGPPTLGPTLLRNIGGAATYLRVDPNPASRARTQWALLGLDEVDSLCLGADPSVVSFSEIAWSVIRSRGFFVVVLFGGGSFNAMVSSTDDDVLQHAMIEGVLRRADLCFLSLLMPSRLSQCASRLRAVRAQGALFDVLHLRPLQRVEGQLLAMPELSWPISQEPPTPPSEASFYSLGVSVQGGPTLPLARLFSETYLREELFAGFRVEAGPIAGEGSLFTARYEH